MTSNIHSNILHPLCYFIMVFAVFCFGRIDLSKIFFEALCSSSILITM